MKIIELAGQGAAPFACMMLADHGAEVVRVCRLGAAGRDPASGIHSRNDVLLRSRNAIEVDLRSAEGASIARDLAASADGLVEGFRPGVMERLGLGPESLLQRNPRLVYGRMTGWGQDGAYSQMSGHDINYIAVAGVLHGCGARNGKPTPPMNLVGDFGGGGLLLAFGMVSALLHAKQTGAGQVVDCAMTDGAALLMSMIWSCRAEGRWIDERGANMLDGGAHFYNTYETSDGRFISIGAIEEKFFATLREKLGIDIDSEFDDHWDQAKWPVLNAKLARIFLSRTRDDWCALLEGADCCFAPVLSLAEAPLHPQNRDRNTFIEVGGVTQPASAPRYSSTQLPLPRMAAGEHRTAEALRSVGYSEELIEELRHKRAIA